MEKFNLQDLIDDMESQVEYLEPLEHNESQAGGKYLLGRLYDYDPTFRYMIGKYMALIVTVAMLRPELLSRIDEDVHKYGNEIFRFLGQDHMVKE